MRRLPFQKSFFQFAAVLGSLLAGGVMAWGETPPADLARLEKMIVGLQSQFALYQNELAGQAKVIELQGKTIAELKSRLELQEVSPAGIPATGEDALHRIGLSEKKETPDAESLVTSYDDGFYFKGKDDTLKIGGWYQEDFTVYEKGSEGNTRFRNRRVRLDVRGVLEDIFEYRLYPQFAGSSANLQEAWLSYKEFPSARIKMGQFKVPFSLESQYSIRWLDFLERSIGATNLQPAEDVGLMVFGNPWGGRVEYAAGVFNGRLRANEDNNDGLDLASRWVFAPFKESGHALLRDLYAGGSFTWGSSDESLAGTGFTTAGGSQFFTFAPNTRHTNDRTRFGAELQWIYGPGDVKAEFLSTRFSDIEMAGRTDHVNVHAWYASASYVLTGEKKVRNKPLIPERVFNPTHGSWGAWEAALRVEQFFVNDSPLSLGFASGVNRVDAISIGLNGWLNRHIRLMFNYVFTHFADAVLLGAEKESSENLFLARAQYNF